MSVSRENVMTDVLGLLRKLAGDWEYTGEITADTRFFGDMGLQSLDVVVLGTAVQEHYSRRIPFAELFSRAGRRGIPDIPVNEWVDFIWEHIQGDGSGSVRVPEAGTQERG